jgi:hypothetical protein
MNENLITWTPQNIITVFLMALAGWAVVGLLLRFALRSGKGAGSSYGANTTAAAAI